MAYLDKITKTNLKWKHTDKVRFGSVLQINSGTSNPWATSTTSEFVAIVYSENKLQAIKYVEDNLKTSINAPITKVITKIENGDEGFWYGDEFIIHYLETVYFN